MLTEIENNLLRIGKATQQSAVSRLMEVIIRREVHFAALPPMLFVKAFSAVFLALGDGGIKGLRCCIRVFDSLTPPSLGLPTDDI